VELRKGCLKAIIEDGHGQSPDVRACIPKVFRGKADDHDYAAVETIRRPSGVACYWNWVGILPAMRSHDSIGALETNATQVTLYAPYEDVP